MSSKAARGTKRVCQNCGNKFYDLDRDPITCPICNTVFQLVEPKPKAAIAGNAADDEDEDEIAAPAAGVELVSLEEVEAEDEEIPDIEDGEIDIEEDEADLGDEDETFIEVEDDDDGDDVTGIVSGSREDDAD
jgi:uncharacterized protein (TIGR02300 family)